MPHSLRHVCAVFVLICTTALGLVSCTEDASTSNPSGEEALDACTVTLSQSQAEPTDSVGVHGVPASMGDSLFAVVYAPSDSLATVGLMRRVADSTAALRVPLHPSLQASGGPVEVMVTNGDQDCTAAPMTIAALPTATGTVQQVTDTMQTVARRHAALFGVSETALGEAPLDSLPTFVLPMAVGYRLLGHESDSTSVMARIDDIPQYEVLLNGLLTKGRALEVMSAQLHGIRRAERALQQEGHTTFTTTDARSASQPASPSASLSHRTPAPSPPVQPASFRPHPSTQPARNASASPEHLPPAAPASATRRTPSVSGSCPNGSSQTRSPDFVDCGRAAIAPTPISEFVEGLSAERLSALMNMSLSADISLDPEVVKHLDLAIHTLDTSAAGLALAAGLAKGPIKRPAEAVAAGWELNSLYLKSVRFYREAESALLPRYLVDLQVEMDPVRYDEDQSDLGFIRTIDVQASNKGWKLDRHLVNIVLANVDIDWVKGFSNHVAAPDISEPLRALGAEMFNETLTNEFEESVRTPFSDPENDGASTGTIICIPPETFPPVSIKDDAWSQVRIIEGRSIDMQNHLTYYPADPGVSRFRISSMPPSGGVMRFGGQMIQTCPQVEVMPIQVLMDPPRQQVAPGDEVRVVAEVRNAEDTQVEWSIEQGNGRILQAQPIGAGLNEALVRVPNPMEGAVIVKATSTADRSHLRSPPQERSANARLHGEPVPLAGICDPETFGAYVNEQYSGPPLASEDFLDPQGTKTPNPVRIQAGGLITDGGVACSHHVGVQSPERMDESIAQMSRSAAVADSLAERGQVTGDDMAEAIEDMQEAQPPAHHQTRDVVFQVYSPSPEAWQAGALARPRAVQHNGVGGWQRNAALLVNIHLVGTSPDDLEPGRRYEARAASTSSESEADVVLTSGPFYTQWTGYTRPASACSPEHQQEQQQELAACERAVQRLADQHKQIEEMAGDMPEGAEEFLPDFGQMWERDVGEAVNCEQEVGLLAFEGEVHTVHGAMSGTVTIHDITPNTVEGSFTLSGSGTRTTEQYEYATCPNSPQISGSRFDKTSTEGSLMLRGDLHAPNHSPGAFHVTFTTVTVEPPSGR